MSADGACTRVSPRRSSAYTPAASASRSSDWLITPCAVSYGRRRWGSFTRPGIALTTATTMYREMDMRFWLEQAEAEMKECT
jgi:hypothetical protein